MKSRIARQGKTPTWNFVVLRVLRVLRDKILTFLRTRPPGKPQEIRKINPQRDNHRVIPATPRHAETKQPMRAATICPPAAQARGVQTTECRMHAPGRSGL